MVSSSDFPNKALFPPPTFFVSEFSRKHVPFFGGVVSIHQKPRLKWGEMFMAVFGAFITKPVFPLTTLDDSELLQLYSRVTFFSFFLIPVILWHVIARNINSSYSWLYTCWFVWIESFLINPWFMVFKISILNYSEYCNIYPILSMIHVWITYLH